MLSKYIYVWGQSLCNFAIEFLEQEIMIDW